MAAAVFMSMPGPEPVLELVVIRAGELLDQAVEADELLTDRLADLGVAAGRVGLELTEQEFAVTQQVAVGAAHRLEDVLGRRVLGARSPTRRSRTRAPSGRSRGGPRR